MASEWQKIGERFRRNRPAVAGAVFIGLSVIVAMMAYALVPEDSPDANMQIAGLALKPPGYTAELVGIPLEKSVEKPSLLQYLIHGQPSAYRWAPADAATERPPGSILEKRMMWLGSDKYGRCIFSRLLLGFRVSLMVGGIAVLISLTIGLFFGLISGYFGGRTDEVVMLVINTIWSIPTLLLVFAIVLALGRGIGIIFLAVGLTMWVDVARVVRGQVLALRDLPFVEAARSMGLGHARIIQRHILPNLLGPVLVVAAGNFATAILVESGLSYLGFGVQPPAPSWGSMLNENYGYALAGKPLLAMAPALAIALMVLAFNLVGNGLRDAMDVR